MSIDIDFSLFDVPRESSFTINNGNSSPRMGVSVNQTTNCFGLNNYGTPTTSDYSVLGTTTYFESNLGQKWHYTTAQGTEVIVKKRGNDYLKALWRSNKFDSWKILGYDGGGLSFLDTKVVRSMPEHIDLTSSTAKAPFPFRQLHIGDEFKGFQSLKGLASGQLPKLKNTITSLLKIV